MSETRISLSPNDADRVERWREVLVEVEAADLSEAPRSLGRLQIVVGNLLDLIERGQR